VIDRRSLLLGGAATVGALGCDALTTVANPELPLWVTHPGSALSVFASRDLTAISGRPDGEPYERSVPTIDPAHRRLFIGTSDGGMYALSAMDLSTSWRFQTSGAVQSQALYDPREDVVYFGSNDGALYKLRGADGKMLWRFASNAEITRPPILYRGALLAMNANDTLVSLNPATGELNWYRQHAPAGGMEISGYAGATVYEGVVYTALSTGLVVAYKTADGSPAWRTGVDLTADAEQGRGSEELRYLDVDTTPIVTKVGDTELILVAHYEGGLYALDRKSGAPLWVNDAATGVTDITLWDQPVRPNALGANAFGASAGFTAAARVPRAEGRYRVLIASSGLTGIWGVDPASGKELWRRSLPTGGVSAAVPWSGAALVGTTGYGVFLLSPLDGGIVDGIGSGEAFAGSPAAHGLRAYVISNEGTLLALSLHPPKRRG